MEIIDPNPYKLGHLRTMIERSRELQDPDLNNRSLFEAFVQVNKTAVSEGDVLSTILPILCGNSNIPSGQNVLFDGLQALKNEDSPLARPDFYDGALPANIDERVKVDLGPFIIPSTANSEFPIVPNFFMEVTVLGGDTDAAKCRAWYNSALGTRAIHSLQIYKEERFDDDMAYAITTVYDAGTGTLDLYVTYPRLTYPRLLSISHGFDVYPLHSFVLTGDPDTFRRGVTAFRNARELAKMLRDRLIEGVNSKAQQPHIYSTSLWDEKEEEIPGPKSTKPPSVLFVCRGNVCRSIIAEAVFAKKISHLSLTANVDSAGTHTDCTLQLPDPRALRVLEEHGIISVHKPRQVTCGDLAEFDYILAMDRQNFQDIQSLKKRLPIQTDKQLAEVMLFGTYGGENGEMDDGICDGGEVADPVNRANDGFEKVYQQCEEFSNGFIKRVLQILT